MLGAAITLVFCAVVAFGARSSFRRLLEPLDPAAAVGVAGLLGLGLLGTLLLFLGLLNGGLKFSLALAVGYGVWCAVASFRHPFNFRLAPPPRFAWFCGPLLALAGLLALGSVLTPADASEWDSLAYHLAVPKLWLEAGQMYSVPFIHHSNFPFAIDNLFLLGLQWGGQTGAKAFIFAMASLGILTIFGFARQRYGGAAGWWSALTFATMPVVLWLTGTAYIDVPNALCAGIGILLVAQFAESKDKRLVVLAGLCLGLAAGSKYTGLQTILAVSLVVVAVGAYRRQVLVYGRAALVLGAVSIAVASPWYLRNIVWTGNPVYPFFYEQFGGRNWSKEHAAIYKNEQQTFGVGRTAVGRDPKHIGHAVLGLAYQPGRYINPSQSEGGGSPLGAVGVPILTAMLAWLISGRSKAFEATALLMVLISFGMWFYLSQQSRYIITLGVPLCVLLGGGVARLRAGPVLAFVAALQAMYSLWLIQVARVDAIAAALSGNAEPASRVPFATAAASINRIVPKTGKIALYDEVFGYLLDVPYSWANPGHSQLIPYEALGSGNEYADEMQRLGFTHVYINLSRSVRPAEQTREWLDAMRLTETPSAFDTDRRSAYMRNFEQRFVPLIAEAVAAGRLKPVQSFDTGLLLEFTPVR